MTIRLGNLEWVARLAGVPFPEADEEALWRCARAWYTAADQLRRLPPVAHEIGDSVATALRGVAAARFAEVWSPVGAPDGLFHRLADACDVLGGACERAAERVEQTKLAILAQLAALAAGIAGLGVPVPGLAVVRGLAVAQMVATARLVARAEIVRLAQALGRPIAVPTDIDDLLDRVRGSLGPGSGGSGGYPDPGTAPDGWAGPVRKSGVNSADRATLAREALAEGVRQFLAKLPRPGPDGSPGTVLAMSGVDGRPSGQTVTPPPQPGEPPRPPTVAPIPTAPAPPGPIPPAAIPAPVANPIPAPPSPSGGAAVPAGPGLSPPTPRPGAGATSPPGWPPPAGSPPPTGPPPVGAPPPGPPSAPAGVTPASGFGAASGPGPHPPGAMTAVVGLAGVASPAPTRPAGAGGSKRPTSEPEGAGSATAGPASRDDDEPTEPAPVSDDEALALARACLFATDAGYGFYPPGDAHRAAARAVAPVDGRVAIDLVGDQDGFTLDSGRLTPVQFAGVLRKLIDTGEIMVREGECLWLITRSLGEGPTVPPAATLARQVGIDVVGPDGSVFPAADPDGAEDERLVGQVEFGAPGQVGVAAGEVNDGPHEIPLLRRAGS